MISMHTVTLLVSLSLIHDIRVEDISEQELSDVMNVNLLSNFWTVQVQWSTARVHPPIRPIRHTHYSPDKAAAL